MPSFVQSIYDEAVAEPTLPDQVYHGHGSATPAFVPDVGADHVVQESLPEEQVTIESGELVSDALNEAQLAPLADQAFLHSTGGSPRGSPRYEDAADMMEGLGAGSPVQDAFVS